MPIVEALNNANLQDYHWDEIKLVMDQEKISKVMKQEDYPIEEKQFSLGELVKFDVADKADLIVNISTTAT